jgi:hypothetical protein
VKPEIYNFKHALQVGVSVRVKFKSEEREKQINQEIRRVDMMICFTKVRFQRT